MAIQYVGGQTTSWAGATGADQTVNFALTNGLASTPAAGDLVVISYAVGSQARNATLAISGYTNLTQLNASAVTQDISQVVAYKVMGGTPDTSVNIVQTGNVADGGAVNIMVFRGVDATTPLDVTSTTATGTGTGRFNPASITPTDGRAWILVAGASGAATGAVHTAPDDFYGTWISVNGADTNDATASMGFYSHHTGGAYDPPAISAGGTTGANDSWTCYTLALRPSGAVIARASQTLDDVGSETTWVFNGSVPPGITVNSSPVGYAKNASGYIQKFAANVGRVTDLGIMVEPSVTTNQTFGIDLGVASYSLTALALGSVIGVDPTGVTDRHKPLQDTSTSNTAHRASRNATSQTTGPVVHSAYVAADQYNYAVIGFHRFTTDGCYRVFDLTDGSIGSSVTGASFANVQAGSEQLADGIWRIWVAADVTLSGALTCSVQPSLIKNPTMNNVGPNYVGTIGSGIRAMWGQVESANRPPTSFIGSNSADKTRAADDISIDTVPTGTHTLRFVFDDDTTQDVAQTATTNYAIPTTLNRFQVKKIIALGSGSGTAQGTVTSGGAGTSVGTAAQTLASVTQTAAGTVTVKAGASQTLATVTQTAAGNITTKAAAAQTLATVTQTAAAKAIATASASQTLASVTQTAAGKAIVTAGASQTLATITQVAGSGTSSTGAASQTLDSITQTAEGTSPQLGVSTGSANQTLDGITQVAGAQVVEIPQPEQDDDAEGFGGPWLELRNRRRRQRAEAEALAQPRLAGAAQALDGVSQVAAGTAPPAITAGHSATLDGVVSVASGVVYPVRSGGHAATLGDATQTAGGWSPSLQDERDMLREQLADVYGDLEDARTWLAILST